MRIALVSLGFLAVLCCVGGSAATEARTGKIVLREFSFTPPAGWSHSVAEADVSRDSMAWVANVLVPRGSSWTFPPEEMLRDLPPAGTALLVEAFEGDPCASSPVLRLAADDIWSGDYEGQPAEHVSSASTYAVRAGRCVFAQAWFGVNHPSEQMLSEVNRILGSVQLSE